MTGHWPATRDLSPTALLLIALPAMPLTALAQSQGEAPSGVGTVQPAKPTRTYAPPKPAWDIAGRWTWKARCTTGVWVGGWSIVPTAPGRFKGGYTGTNIADVGIIVNGRLKGRTITLLHKFTDIFGKAHDDRVRGTLTRTGNGLAVDGTSGDETFSCTFRATKN